MTAAAYSTNLASIFTDGNTTGWTALGGGASGLNQETEYFIQGTSCLSKNAWTPATKGMIFDSGGDQGGTPADGAYIMWVTHLTPASLDTIANGGIQMLIGSATGAYNQYYVAGNDTFPFGGWILAAVKEQQGNADNTTGSPSATVEQTFGALFALPTTAPTKGSPAAIDAIRFGRCDIVIEFGTGADAAATFDGIITNLETASLRYGLLAQRNPGGAFENSGLIQFGSSTNAVRFNDANKVFLLRDHPHVTANFHTWEVQNASSDITFENLVVKALGSTARGRWVTTDNATMSWTACNFIDMGTFGFDTNATILGCTFLRCLQIDANGADLSESKVLQSDVAGNDGALLWDVATDPDGLLDNMEFSHGDNGESPTEFHHAIEFGPNTPANITLRGISFSGFSSSDDVDGSVFQFTSVESPTPNYTLNLVGCSHDGSGFTVDARNGANVTIVIDPVTTTVHVEDEDGADLQNARVYLEAADGTGDLPFEDSVTITRSGTVATVAHTGHGLVTGNLVKIKGITDKTEDNNGTHQITVLDANSYTYVTTDSGSTSYTGSITSTGVVFNGLTDANGDVSDTRTWTNPQPVTGRIRKSTASPRYKTFPISGTISTTQGLTITAMLVRDD